MQTPKPRFTTGRSTLLFGLATAIWVALILTSTAVCLLVNLPFAAVLTLGFGTVILGVLRWFGPVEPWFASRKRWLDAGVLVAVGIGLLALSAWVYASPA